MGTLATTSDNSGASRVVYLDTETTGLNIVHDKPFMVQTGFVNEEDDLIVDVWTPVDLHKHTICSLLESAKVIVGHNILFDMHMLLNIGIDLRHVPWLDTMSLIRLTQDSIPVDRGGPPLSLKGFCNSLAHDEVVPLNSEELAVKQQLSQLNTLYAIEVNDKVSSARCSDELCAEKSDDDIAEYLRATGVLRKPPGYEDIEEDIMLPYAKKDIELLHLLTQKLFKECIDVNKKTLQREMKVLKVLFDMERVGLCIDSPRIRREQKWMEVFEAELNERFTHITGITKASERKRFSEWLEAHSKGLPGTKSFVVSTAKGVLQPYHNATYMDADAIKACDAAWEASTLHKWQKAYCKNLLFLAVNDIVYPQANPYGTVTGRFSSSFQQFPHGSLSTPSGEVLPRNWFVPHPDKVLLCIDLSTVELRIVTLLTILLGFPCHNMASAYVPVECTDETGRVYSYKYLAHEIYDESTGALKNVWRDKTGATWKPTDLHALTTKEALGIDESHPDFKRLRSEVGKRLNFSKLYGAGIAKIREFFPEKTDAEHRELDKAFMKAFPEMRNYNQWCQEHSKLRQEWCYSIYGRGYRNQTGHNLANTLVQGTAADYLKEKLLVLSHYIKEAKLKTRMIMTVHDEVLFDMPKDETTYIPNLLCCIESYKNVIPIVAEASICKETWGSKETYVR